MKIPALLLAARIGPTNRAIPLRYAGDSAFAAGGNRFSFLREGTGIVKLRFDGVSVASLLERVP